VELIRGGEAPTPSDNKQGVLNIQRKIEGMGGGHNTPNARAFIVAVRIIKIHCTGIRNGCMETETKAEIPDVSVVAPHSILRLLSIRNMS
jgi:hypothetical protein